MISFSRFFHATWLLGRYTIIGIRQIDYATWLLGDTRLLGRSEQPPPKSRYYAFLQSCRMYTCIFASFTLSYDEVAWERNNFYVRTHQKRQTTVVGRDIIIDFELFTVSCSFIIYKKGVKICFAVSLSFQVKNQNSKLSVCSLFFFLNHISMK